MLLRSTLQLLRFHFSFFLLPVYLFALSEVKNIDWAKALAIGAVLHLMVYPSSNGYNSYMDKDETPIGGLQQPMHPTKQLYYTTLLLDAMALAIVFVAFSPWVALGILCYIIASRAYSYRGIRLKRFPYLGFITVFICQGALVFWVSYVSAGNGSTVPLTSCIIASCLIGALYPLTQIYQHEADLKDGVVTISYKLGKRGSFIFSGILFIAATGLLYIHYNEQNNLDAFYLFLTVTAPVVIFFVVWMIRVWRNEEKANFKNSLLMNVIATLCTTIFFSLVIYRLHFE